MLRFFLGKERLGNGLAMVRGEGVRCFGTFFAATPVFSQQPPLHPQPVAASRRVHALCEIQPASPPGHLRAGSLTRHDHGPPPDGLARHQRRHGGPHRRSRPAPAATRSICHHRTLRIRGQLHVHRATFRALGPHLRRIAEKVRQCREGRADWGRSVGSPVTTSIIQKIFQILKSNNLTKHKKTVNSKWYSNEMCVSFQTSFLLVRILYTYAFCIRMYIFCVYSVCILCVLRFNGEGSKAFDIIAYHVLWYGSVGYWRVMWKGENDYLVWRLGFCLVQNDWLGWCILSALRLVAVWRTPRRMRRTELMLSWFAGDFFYL